MAQVLAAIPVHGIDAILPATQAALAMGKPSGEHVQYLIAQLKDKALPRPERAETSLVLNEEPRADVDRYDRLRHETAAKAIILASVVLAPLMNGGVHVR